MNFEPAVKSTAATSVWRGVFCALMSFAAVSTAIAEEPAAQPAPAPEQWFLMDTLHSTPVGSFLEDNRINIYGWTEGSYTASSVGHAYTPNYFDNPTDQFLLNQNWLVFERTVDTTASEPTFGFHSAWILPGTDARYTLSRGLFDEQSGHVRVDAFHLYAEAYLPSVLGGLDLIIGKNATPVFYEVEDAPVNPLYSHSYIYQYGGPFTHTGVQAKVKVSDVLTLDTRLTTGNDIWFDQVGSPTFIESAIYTSPDGVNALTSSFIAGSGTYDVGEEFNNYNLVDFVFTHKFNDALTYALDAVFGYERNVPGIGTGTWYAAANYLTYSLCDNLSATARFELFKDQDGIRSGAEGLFTATTVGLNYKITKSLIVRPELRYDYFSNGDRYDGDSGEFTAGGDLIVRW